MIFDSLITTHSSITYTASSVEKIYIEQALKLLPTHVLSKIITEGWKIVVYDDVNELISIDNKLSTVTTGVTEYEMRRVFVKGVVDGRNEIAFKSTLLHELTHVFDTIIDGSYCNWKSEKYYNSELENLITQEGSNFSEYAQSDIKEYLSTVVSRYLLKQTDFSTVPLTKAFIEKYYFMCEDIIEQRLRNLENNAVTYIELDETYNKLKYSKLNKENDKYVLQLPTSSSGGSSSGGSGDSNVIYDNNVTFSTSVSYFALNKTTISYIDQTLDSNTVGTWELKTIMGSTSAIAIQIRTFILNGRDSAVTDFKTLPHEQRRFYDYNNSRAWSNWEDVITDINTRLTTLENNSGSSSGGNNSLISRYIYNENKVLQPTLLDMDTGIFTCSNHGLTEGQTIIPIPNGVNTVLNIHKELFTEPNKPLMVTSVTNDTFILKTTDGNIVSYSTTDNSEADVKKYHFEQVNPVKVELSDIVSNNIKIIIHGVCGIGDMYFGITKDGVFHNSYNVIGLGQYKGAIALSSNATHAPFRPFRSEIEIKRTILGFGFMFENQQYAINNRIITDKSISRKYGVIQYPYQTFNGIMLGSSVHTWIIANGTTIEVYNMEE